MRLQRQDGHATTFVSNKEKITRNNENITKSSKDNYKRTNWKIIVLEDVVKVQVNGMDYQLTKIIEENFPNS